MARLDCVRRSCAVVTVMTRAGAAVPPAATSRVVRGEPQPSADTLRWQTTGAVQPVYRLSREAQPFGGLLRRQERVRLRGNDTSDVSARGRDTPAASVRRSS